MKASIVSHLRQLPVLMHCEDSLIKELAEGLIFRTLSANETLFHARDSAEACYIVLSGGIKLVRPTMQGKDVVMCFCRAGDFVGAGVMINPSPRFPLTAIAVEDVTLLQIPRSIYLEKWQAHPQVARAVNASIMGRLLEFQEDKAMAVSPVPQKIASFLLRTLDQQNGSEANRIDIKLARKNIADRVGTTVETVIRILSQWTQKGWVRTENQYIEILNRTALKELLDQDSED